MVTRGLMEDFFSYGGRAINGCASVTRDWINKTSMTSFRAMVFTVIIAFVVMWFTVIAGRMLLDRETSAAVMNVNPSISAAARTTENNRFTYGMKITEAVFYLIGSVILGGVISHGVERGTSREKYEAQERGKIQGAAVAASIAEHTRNGTKERLAVNVEGDNATVNAEVKKDDESEG